MCFTKWTSATLAIALLAGNVAGADTVTGGKIKSIDADAKTFVMTDSADKDHTFKLGDNFVVNRAGKESKGTVAAGDTIHVSYERGPLDWTAHYVLVQDGNSKTCGLICGSVKSYDADKKELTFTNSEGKTSTYPMGNAMVRLNMADIKIETVKNGDQALIIVDTIDAKPTLRTVIVNRPAEREIKRTK